MPTKQKQDSGGRRSSDSSKSNQDDQFDRGMASDGE